MSIRLPTTDLSTAVVGTTGTISWAQQHISPALSVQMMPGPHSAVHLQVYNESGCGILINFAGDTNTTFMPAGGWRIFAVGPDIQQYTWVVDYVLPNAPVTKLYTIWYAPGEPLDETGFLGNSPIGGTSVTTQVVQDGQTVGQQIVESTPTGVFQTILITTDGKILLKTQTNTTIGLQIISPSVPGVNVNEIDTRILNDTGTRAALAIRSDGYGSLNVGAGVAGAASSLFGSAGGLNTNAAIAAVNGQASVGSFGVPVIVAQTGRITVTTLPLTTILTFSIPTAGRYRLNVSLVSGNGSPHTPEMQATFTNAKGNSDTALFYANDNGATSTVHPLDAHSCTIGANWGTVDLAPLIIDANTGTLTIVYTPNTGTPNDIITALVERLA